MTSGQRPWAVVVGCSDSRVPVEAVFDVGPGELFVVRTAGHVLSDAGYASVRYAVQELGARLVVVLGHEECGAVAAARNGDAPDYLASESVAEMREWFDAAGFSADQPVVIGAAYQLASGEVHWLD